MPTWNNIAAQSLLMKLVFFNGCNFTCVVVGVTAKVRTMQSVYSYLMPEQTILNIYCCFWGQYDDFGIREVKYSLSWRRGEHSNSRVATCKSSYWPKKQQQLFYYMINLIKTSFYKELSLHFCLVSTKGTSASALISWNKF